MTIKALDQIPDDHFSGGSNIGGDAEVDELANLLNRMKTDAVSAGSGAIAGLALSYTSATAVAIAAGTCRDSTNGEEITVASPLAAAITASGANGLDTGSEAGDTWYAVYVIDGDAVDVAALLSESFSAPTMPTGYTRWRRVGAVRNDGSSDFISFVQLGNGRSREVFYDADHSGTELRALDGGTAQSFTDIDLAAAMPESSVRAQIQAISRADVVGVALRSNGFSNTGGQAFVPAPVASGTPSRIACYMYAPGQIIEYENDAASGDTDVDVISYIDEL